MGGKNIENMDNSVLDKIKSVLLLSLPKDGKAVLYGSQARGDNRHDSDWDILVIVDKGRLYPEDYDSITYPLTKLGWDLNIEINPIMYTKQEWAAQRCTPFYHNVHQDGIALA